MEASRLHGIFKELIDSNSKNYKMEVLKKYKDDSEFREVLNFLLNPYIVTGLSTKKINKKINTEKVKSTTNINDLNELIEFLIENKNGKDSDILSVQEYIDIQESSEVKEFIKGLVTKNLKVGMTANTVNKVYGKGTIPIFKVQLAESFSDREHTVKGEFYITLKLDGNRCIAVNEEDGVKFFTRSGQPILGMTELEKEFNTMPKNWVYDGEVLLDNENDLSSKDLFRATQKVLRKDGEKKKLQFYIFDALPIKEFDDGKSKHTYEKRRNMLDNVFKPHASKLDRISILPVLYKGSDKEAIAVTAKHIISQGFEGVMLNTADGLYINKRNDGLLKLKEFKTADLLVMSIEKAIDGQFEGLLSRVNVEYKGNLVGVGSGFTQEERKRYAENPDEIVGRIIEIQYHEESQDEEGNVSLRFPTFKTIRDDKGVDDINYGG